jgi:hypothetical protein
MSTTNSALESREETIGAFLSFLDQSDALDIETAKRILEHNKWNIEVFLTSPSSPSPSFYLTFKLFVFSRMHCFFIHKLKATLPSLIHFDLPIHPLPHLQFAHHLCDNVLPETKKNKEIKRGLRAHNKNNHNRNHKSGKKESKKVHHFSSEEFPFSPAFSPSSNTRLHRPHSLRFYLLLMGHKRHCSLKGISKQLLCVRKQKTNF